MDKEALATIERAQRWSSIEPGAITRTLRKLETERIRLPVIETIGKVCDAAAGPRAHAARGCFVATVGEV